MNEDGKRRKLSYLQLRAIELWLRRGRKSKAQALRGAGYSEAVANQPHKVFETRAVIEELEKRGLGTRGIENNKKSGERTATVFFDVPAPRVISATDFYNAVMRASKEDIARLQARMEEIPDRPVSTSRNTARKEFVPQFYVPSENDTDSFGAKFSPSYSRLPNQSSM
jgi:hypothetical protein